MLKNIFYFWIIIISALLYRGAGAQSWYTINTAEKSMENSRILIRYIDPDRYWGNGLEMINKITGEKIGYTLDTYGCGSAEYDFTGPSAFSRGAVGADYVETDVRFTDCVSVRKQDRLYKNHAVLELRYDALNVLWFEDYWDNDRVPTAYAIHGIPGVILKGKHSRYLAACEAATGHNYFDGWLDAAGHTVSDVSYKGYIIFGSHSIETGRGIGEVYPVSLGTHHFKLWFGADIGKEVPNYECFPATKSNVKRWIFAYEGGLDGMTQIGKAIVDAGRPPAAMVSFSASLPPAAAPYDFQFTNTSTEGYTSWQWNFGDGETAAGTDVSHTFTADGYYRVVLTGSGTAGTDSFYMNIRLPAPDFTAPHLDTVYTVQPGQVAVVFDEKVNPAGAGNRASYKLSRLTGISDVSIQSDGRTVLLTTDTLAADVTYKLTVYAMKDVRGNTAEDMYGWFSGAAGSSGLMDAAVRYTAVPQGLNIHPYPCRDRAVIRIPKGRECGVRKKVYIRRADGAVMRTYSLDAEQSVLTWDLIDSSGNRAEPGIYSVSVYEGRDVLASGLLLAAY